MAKAVVAVFNAEYVAHSAALFIEIREELGLSDDVHESLEEHHVAELLMAELERKPADAERVRGQLRLDGQGLGGVAFDSGS